jgi:phage replication O-like protein O
MANPQSENGHTRIANEIMDTLAKTRIPGESRQVLDFIFRKTYGYHKKADKISTGQFMEATELSSRAVERARKHLRDRNMVFITPDKNDGGLLEYRINKDYDTWLPPTKMTAHPRQKRSLPPTKMTGEPPTKMTGNKSNDKSNYTKTKRQPGAGLRPVLPMDNLSLKELLDLVYRSGFNIYKLINKFKKKAKEAKLLMFGEKYEIPEEVLMSVAQSYLKNKNGIKGEHFPWVLAALSRAATEWWVAKQDKEHQEQKADSWTSRGGVCAIQEVVRSMMSGMKEDQKT